VDSDKERHLEVPAYRFSLKLLGRLSKKLNTSKDSSFMISQKESFVVVQTNEYALYANCIIRKGVIPK
jgi:L-fucose mutarotase/ribose pyranase (RbsD/FucU family)